MLYTGLRRCDAVRAGPAHIRDGRARHRAAEDASAVEIPVHPKLRAIIDATPMVGVKTFLVTSFGKPYTAPGFGNWFRELCDAAGCAGLSAHGLRKATARRLAEIADIMPEDVDRFLAKVTKGRPRPRKNPPKANPRKPQMKAFYRPISPT